MALYKHGNRLTQSQDAAFDAMHAPGMDALHQGIYCHCWWAHTSVAESSATQSCQRSDQVAIIGLSSAAALAAKLP